MNKSHQLLLGAGLLCATLANAFAGDGFAGSEHKAIGDTVKIKFPGQIAQAHYMMCLNNGVHASYGDLVSMGDFFGVPTAPISKGLTDAEREQRFQDAFATVADDKKLGDQVRAIRTVLLEEEAAVQKAVKEGKLPSQAYADIAEDVNRKYNCITGGGCGVGTWWLTPGRHLKLEKTNYDHFGQDAWMAYQAGHRAAMRTAVKAKTTGDLNLLNRAYAMNAFACHFLSDRYASGHVRTPRYELAQHVTPAVVGSLLAKYMHDEDSLGLHVRNAYGQHWLAVGDGNYYEGLGKEHQKHVIAAMQKSADEVYSAYQHGMMIADPAEHYMLPYADEDMTTCGNDTAALFSYDEKTSTVYRRRSLGDLKSCSWTKWWMGWSTLAKLAAIKGMPTHVQGQLANSEFAVDAVKAGLITDENIIASMQKK